MRDTGQWKLDSGFLSSVNSGFLELYSGFHQKSFTGIRNLDSFMWGERVADNGSKG